VGEWNSAIGTARFTDDAQNRVSINPGAWQVSLGYQLDWNPWLEAIGAQGTYLTMSYSESRDFGGAQRDIDGERSRVGFLPRRRLLISAGEWFMDGIKLAIEYSRGLGLFETRRRYQTFRRWSVYEPDLCLVAVTQFAPSSIGTAKVQRVG